MQLWPISTYSGRCVGFHVTKPMGVRPSTVMKPQLSAMAGWSWKKRSKSSHWDRKSRSNHGSKAYASRSSAHSVPGGKDRIDSKVGSMARHARPPERRARKISSSSVEAWPATRETA